MNDERPTVLVVDDTPANIDLLSAMLREQHRVKVATNGPKALVLARAEPQPDIILLDIMMPEMSGYEVCRSLKQDPGTADIPVIFITAKSQVEDEQRGLELGAVDYITKPFSPLIVATRVRTQLALYHQARRLRQENAELKERAQAGFRDLSATQISQTIQSGESHRVEFKSTLRWNLYTDKSDRKIENACLKTVAGYMNAEGGLLLIGVDDDGVALGLDNDRFKSEDKLLLHWHNLIKDHLGAEFIQCLRATLESLEGSRILVVQCLSSPRPVFFSRDNDEAFYVRMGNTTPALKPSEVLAYIDQRFGGAR